MEKNWIEKLREKLANFEVSPSEGLWARIEAVLYKERCWV